MGAWADERIRQAHSSTERLEKRVEAVEEQLEAIRGTLDNVTPENSWAKLKELNEKLNSIYYQLLGDV